MSEKVTPKELDQMMDRMFSIDPKDVPFFRKQLTDLTQTNEGSRLLRSLDKNFNGRKIDLISKPFIEMEEEGGDYGGYFSVSKSEIAVVKTGQLLDDARIPITLFHELTHWEQHNNNASPGETLTKPDAYFAAWMVEADARASSFFFAQELASQGNWWQRFMHKKGLEVEMQQHDYSDPRCFIHNCRDFVQGRHPDWTDEQVQKETKKMMLVSILRETNLDSYWHRYYDKDYTRNAHPASRPKDGYDIGRGRPFEDVMGYFMDKYGLTQQECLDLQQEIISKTSVPLPKQESRKIDENTTDIYLDGEISHRVSRSGDKTEVIFPETLKFHPIKSIMKKDGTVISIALEGSNETFSAFDEKGRIISRIEYDPKKKLLRKRHWNHTGEDPFFECVDFQDGKARSSYRKFRNGDIERNYSLGSSEICTRRGRVSTDKDGVTTYVVGWASKYRLIDGQFSKIQTAPITNEEKNIPATQKEIKGIQELIALSQSVEHADSLYPNTLLENTGQNDLFQDIHASTPRPTNMQVLQGASVLREQLSTIPKALPQTSRKASRKLESATLSRLRRGGQGE